MINVTKTNLPKLTEYNKYLKEIWRKNWVTNNGKFVQLLERELERHLSIKNLLVVANGTLALQLAIKSLKLSGEVITTPFTFIATTTSLIWEGVTPVFADINPETFNIDPDDVERKITKKTSAILAVHVYGNPCDLKRLKKIAKKYKVKLIFDAAHAFGVVYNGKSILEHGDISTLSFHSTKIFHTIEGGAIIAKNNKIYKTLKLLRNFGIESEERIIFPGINAKMNELQAAMGLCNLKFQKKDFLKRKKIYELYIRKLKKLNFIKFQKIEQENYNYSYMPVIFKNKIMRDKIYNQLIKNGIKPRKYFYPLCSDFSFVKDKYSFKNAKKISDCVLCLPLYSTLKEKDVVSIVNIIIKESTSLS